MQLPMCHLLVKNHLWNQRGEREIEKLPNVAALSFKTCQESFSLENAVPLTSSHAAEPRRITMTRECPLCQGNLHRATLRWGRGRQREGKGGKQKGTRLPPVTAHPRAKRGKSITCGIKQKLVHKVQPSESCTHPCKHSPSSLPCFQVIETPPPPPPWLTPTAQCKFWAHAVKASIREKAFWSRWPRALLSLMVIYIIE